MSIRVQVIMDEEEAARFKSQAIKESKSLSAWLRHAGKKMLEMNQQKQSFSDAESLKEFFRKCKEREDGEEPGWGEHKRLILESYGGSGDLCR